MVQLLVRLAQVVKALLVEITQEQFPHTGVVVVVVLAQSVRLVQI
jgi:S-adenosylmethionine/arginine decarboxylase-like enzyme